LNRRQQTQLASLVVCWVIATGFYWWWWLDPAHLVSAPLMILNSLLFFYITGLPGYSFFFALRMARPHPELQIPKGLTVAMVATKVPDEPWPMVKDTLKRMVDQAYPHDTWLADEDPSPEARAWCQKNHVKLSTRKDAPGYHCEEWPRRKKCKEGNLAYFYDHYGYQDYDVVVQLDADHFPEMDYLDAMLKPFANPDVGYVAAPSICDRNASQSWTARGRLFFESFLHGPLQMGYTNHWRPICIGSHYAVRTKALKQIGGLGPELAEDLSTSLLFISHGWQGAFAYQAICHGLGPATFQDCMVQEFQWSKSITSVLIKYSGSWLSHLPLRLRFQLLFVQWFYPIRGFLSTAALAIGAFALLTSQPWILLYYPRYLALYFIQVLLALLPCLWLRRQGLLRPYDARLFTWEVWLFEITRGPWIMLGVMSSVFDHFFHRTSVFRITRKDGMTPALSTIFLSPYLLLACLSVGLVVIIPTAGDAQGYYLLILLSATVFALAALAVVVLSKQETGLPWARLGLPISLVTLSGLFVVFGWTSRHQEVMATLEPASPVEVFK
jgi:cellulose synthase (UDP-forming)